MVKTRGTNIHRHKFNTNIEGTARQCTTCGVQQVKRSGKWTPLKVNVWGTRDK